MEASQQHLYHMIFRTGGYRDNVNPQLLTLPQLWNRSWQDIAPDANRTLFLFGKSQLSPFHIRMIYELGKFITIYLYQVNPCFEFWEDVTTPGEDRWRRIKAIEFDNNSEEASLTHDENENYLLKLWGRSGRETIKLLSMLEEAGSREMNTTSEWLLPVMETPSDSSLHLVQNQILNRVSPIDSKLKIKRDTSIQIASCTDIFRETETVYNSILYNLSVNPKLSMSDIAIMVPDMSMYGPVIQSVFNKFPERITYSMIDSTAAIDSLFGKAVSLLLEIADGSFTRKTIIDLLFNQCFLDAHEMDIEDARTCLSWADSLNIFHTFKKSESNNPVQNLYTWHQGLQRLRFGRIFAPNNNYSRDGMFLDFKNIVPFTDMNTGNQTLIDTFSGCIELLHARTKHLQQLKASGEEWLNIIRSLINSFIVVPSERPEEEIVYTTLLARMKKLVAYDRNHNCSIEKVLSFSFIKEFLQENIITIPSTRGSYLSGGINISALVPKRQIPFKIIYVMGMQEGLFPGSADTSTLNIMNVRRHLADVNKPDTNRYLFLEILLSAREKFYLTYVSKDLKKDQDYFPNSVLGQFLTYLNNYVVKEGFSVVPIPATGSSNEYLLDEPDKGEYSDLVSTRVQGKFQPTNYSLSDRIVLLQHAEVSFHAIPALKKKVLLSIPDFSVHEESTAAGESSISLSLRDLAYFLQDPAESTVRWHLGLYDGTDEDTSSNEIEPFFSVFPYAYRFINDTLNYCVFNNSKSAMETFMNDYFRHAKFMSATPAGVFGDIDFESFKSTIHERFYGKNSILQFLEEHKNFHCYRNLRFGTAVVSIKPDFTVQPLPFKMTRGDRSYTVELNGLLPILWKNQDTANCETLVITNSDKPNASNLLLPFLFYTAASTGKDEKLLDFIGEGSFTIHIACRKGIVPFTYRLGSRDCAIYMDRLIHDFLDEGSFDNIPLAVINKYQVLHPINMKPAPSDEDKSLYQQLLARFIDEEREKFISSYRSTKFIELMDATVPIDAYDKVRNRLGMLFKPFPTKEHSEHE